MPPSNERRRFFHSHSHSIALLFPERQVLTLSVSLVQSGPSILEVWKPGGASSAGSEVTGGAWALIVYALQARDRAEARGAQTVGRSAPGPIKNKLPTPPPPGRPGISFPSVF